MCCHAVVSSSESVHPAHVVLSRAAAQTLCYPHPLSQDLLLGSEDASVPLPSTWDCQDSSAPDLDPVPLDLVSSAHTVECIRNHKVSQATSKNDLVIGSLTILSLPLKC
jgi:hypothetical protein